MPQLTESALHIMVDSNFIFIARFVENVINQAVPDIPISQTQRNEKLAQTLMELSDRCDFEKIRVLFLKHSSALMFFKFIFQLQISSNSLRKLIFLYVQVRNWDFVIKTVEKASAHYLEYDPTKTPPVCF